MHGSVLRFLQECLSPAEVAGKRVLEVGSYDVNGSPRSVIEPLGPKSYLGVDSSEGPGVDRAMNAELLTAHLGCDAFDLVVSTELLEHVVDWRRIVSEMKKAVKPGGLLVLTTRSPGFPYHPYPIDTWRYTKEDFEVIFSDLERLAILSDPEVPGVFLKARKPERFVENDLSEVSVPMVTKP